MRRASRAASARRPHPASNIRRVAPRPRARRRSWWWSSACPRRCRTRSSGFASMASASSPSATSTKRSAGSRRDRCILLIGDGVAPPAQLVADIAAEPEPAVATVPDDEHHEAFERIDGQSRWAGVALVDANMLGSTAAMLGDWDLQSTLLRRTICRKARGALPWRKGAANPCWSSVPSSSTRSSAT